MTDFSRFDKKRDLHGPIPYVDSLAVRWKKAIGEVLGQKRVVMQLLDWVLA